MRIVLSEKLLSTGLEVIKFEYILKIKIKHNDWLLADTCLQAVNHCTLFWVLNELKFYNFEARHFAKKMLTPWLGLIWYAESSKIKC